MSSATSIVHSPFLDALPDHVRQLLIPLAVSKAFSPGDELFRESHAHDDIYLLTQGHVRLEMFVRDRGHLPLMTAGPGDLVGWSPLFSDHHMTATAMAMDHVHTLAFSGARLKELCESNHEVGYHVMRQIVLVLSDRLVATRLQLLDLFQDASPRRQPVDAEC